MTMPERVLSLASRCRSLAKFDYNSTRVSPAVSQDSQQSVLTPHLGRPARKVVQATCYRSSASVSLHIRTKNMDLIRFRSQGSAHSFSLV